MGPRMFRPIPGGKCIRILRGRVPAGGRRHRWPGIGGALRWAGSYPRPRVELSDVLRILCAVGILLDTADVEVPAAVVPE